MGGLAFVTGTGTGIGKTFVTGLMARFLLSRKVDVITSKFVQTGNVGFSEDLDEHRRLMGGVKFAEDAAGLTHPQIFKYPASPHLAASLENKTVDVEFALRSVTKAAEAHALMLVEVAGGLMVPLREDLLTVDMIAKTKLPVILVASAELGSLNSALLSIEALSRRKIPLWGVVYNRRDAAEPIGSDTLRMIRRYLPVYGYASSPVVVAEKSQSEKPLDADFSPIFKGLV